MAVTLDIQNFESRMNNLLNESGLPACILRLVLESRLAEVRAIENNQLRAEMQKEADEALKRQQEYEAQQAEESE